MCVGQFPSDRFLEQWCGSVVDKEVTGSRGGLGDLKEAGETQLDTGKLPSKYTDKN